MLMAAPALVETYSALTRMPAPYRLSGRECLAIIDRDFIANATIIALDVEAYVAMLQQAATDRVAGGRIYDAVIAACAMSGGADTLLTFNERDFLPFASQSMAIIVPQEAS
jgi:predicted nucleic acid-binding protein